ncbi:unnamed protein product [Lymnaea stagnalis]|uniref:Monocarboxylate transporter n=1 Tax=Lymnaea stagnalis TaxID=6523 RepID=A0AAV2IMK2_LYMST
MNMTSSDEEGVCLRVEEEPDVIDRSSEYYKRNVLPVDRGWAWAVCFAGFISYVLFGFSNQLMVVLFTELVEKFESTITTTSLVFMLSTLTFSFVSVVATTFVTPRLGERKMVLCGGVLMASSTIGYALSPSIAVFLVFSVFKGVSTGLMFVATISLIRHYFHKYQSLSQIFCSSGTSVGFIVAPPIIRAVRNEFGIRGTLLLEAGLELNFLAVALLLRPIAMYKFRPELPPLKSSIKEKETTKIDAETLQMEPDKDLNEMQTLHGDAQRSQGDLSYDVLRNEPADGTSPHQDNEHLQYKRENSVKSEGTFSRSGAQTRVSEQRDYGHTHRRNLHASAMSLTSEAGPMGVDAGMLSLEVDDAPDRKFGGLRKWFLVQCDESFFGMWQYRVMMVACLPGAVNMYIRNYIPAIAQARGATPDQGALLLTIVGAVDLGIKFGLGCFANTHMLKPSQLFAISQICLGVLLQFIRFFTSFETLIIMVVIIGLFVGTRVSMMPLMTIEVVGTEKMPQAYSIISTMGTLSVAVMNPMFGAIAEATGGFADVMHIVGACFLISGVLYGLLPFLAQLDNKLTSKEPKSNPDGDDVIT